MIFIGLQKSPLFIDLCIARCLAIGFETPIWSQKRQAANAAVAAVAHRYTMVYLDLSQFMASEMVKLYVKLMKKKLQYLENPWPESRQSGVLVFFWDSLAARVWSQYKFINSSSMFNMRCFSMLHHFSPATFGRKVTVKSPPQGERQQRGSSRPSLVVWLTGEGMAE